MKQEEKKIHLVGISHPIKDIKFITPTRQVLAEVTNLNEIQKIVNCIAKNKLNLQEVTPDTVANIANKCLSYYLQDWVGYAHIFLVLDENIIKFLGEGKTINKTDSNLIETEVDSKYFQIGATMIPIVTSIEKLSLVGELINNLTTELNKACDQTWQPTLIENMFKNSQLMEKLKTAYCEYQELTNQNLSCLDSLDTLEEDDSPDYILESLYENNKNMAVFVDSKDLIKDIKNGDILFAEVELLETLKPGLIFYHIKSMLRAGLVPQLYVLTEQKTVLKHLNNHPEILKCVAMIIPEYAKRDIESSFLWDLLEITRSKTAIRFITEMND